DVIPAAPPDGEIPLGAAGDGDGGPGLPCVPRMQDGVVVGEIEIILGAPPDRLQRVGDARLQRLPGLAAIRGMEEGAVAPGPLEAPGGAAPPRPHAADRAVDRVEALPGPAVIRGVENGAAAGDVDIFWGATPGATEGLPGAALLSLPGPTVIRRVEDGA